jgi:serine/threonine-protein kinase
MSSAGAFPPTANPAGYVPSAGSERALGELERWARGSEKPVCVLRGPPGAGKTLLLKLFAAGVRDRFEAAVLPYPDCDPDALGRWLLGALDAGPAPEPRAALARALEARRPEGPPLLVEIDEADRLPRETAAWLAELAGSSEGALRVLLAANDEAERGGLAAALGPRGETVRLAAALSPREAEAYVQGELERAGADRALCAQFDARALAELHARTGGVPGALRREAARIVLRTELARAAPAARGARAGARVRGAEPGPPRRRALRLGAAALAAGAAAGLALARWLPSGGLAPAPRAVEMPRPSVPGESAAAHAPPAAAAPVAPGPVFVNVNAEPWAEIEVDGEPVGETPIARLALAPGRHRFAARMPDGRVRAREVRVGPGARIVFP